MTSVHGIASAKHKHLKVFLEDQTVKGLPAAIITRLRRAVAALAEADNIAELATFPQWRVHMLQGDRQGVERHRYRQSASDIPDHR